jgi:homoserine kinase
MSTKSNMRPKSATARAPASIGNVGVGFDVLGLAFGAAHDHVTAVREARPGARLGEVTGLVHSLPTEVHRNTALAAAQALLASVSADFGVRLDIDKGVPLCAGMGGSAASAVAAAAAVNALLPEPLPLEALLPFAIEGERVSSDPPPWDNVIAALFGGLVLGAREEEPVLIRRLPVPAGLVAILLHPEIQVETRAARGLLREQVPMRTAVEHSRKLAAFVAGCATGDLALVRAGFEDLLVEPQRAHLLPAFPDVKAAALGAGALGCSFSGSGPSVFAWALEQAADAVEAAMAAAFEAAGLGARAYRAPVDSAGASVESFHPATAAA